MEKEKEKSVAKPNNSETPKSPNSVFSMDSSIESLTFSVGNLSLKNGKIHSICKGTSSMDNGSSLAFSGGNTSKKTQEVGADIQETGWLENSKPVPTPLYPQRIWGVENARRPLFSDLQLSVPAFYQSNNWGGARNSTPQESRENFGTVCQDSTTGRQNQESVNGAVPSGGKIERNDFISLAVNENGSKILQNILKSRDPELTSQILERFLASLHGVPIICVLMTNEWGWHVCSKLIDSCNDQQLAIIVETITMCQDLFINLSNNIYGSKLIKKMIKLLKRSPLIHWLTLSLYACFYPLMMDRIGSYVLSYCLDYLDVRQNALLYESAISLCLHLATHENGCISLNNFIDKIQGSHRQRLLELISKNAVFLSQDPSGNHVVQKVLALENPIFTERICSSLRGHYKRLSLQKWGSHVVEKCLRSTAMECAVEDLLSSSSNQLLQVARDQFGNYVIQSALKVTKKTNNPLHLELLRSLQPHLETLRKGFGRNVFNLIANGVPTDEA
ncbi:hypothetical protein P3X46_030351 [Hevea brasiliensis]|uniref:PUM-HD domain-containing protein n=1 Tax=Hevea brasiliensis TaxID=3981 RepID=A0ABQ9KGZ6_HEVBR|nr:putative pumilio homolog 8, chloroplastic [Hevea brasiliensis]KAJ9139638.1 hypothetical protein P3X46_030351 [Hevea brasiliensis]